MAGFSRTVHEPEPDLLWVPGVGDSLQGTALDVDGALAERCSLASSVRGHGRRSPGLNGLDRSRRLRGDADDGKLGLIVVRFMA